MTVRQAGAPSSDLDLARAADKGADKRSGETLPINLTTLERPHIARRLASLAAVAPVCLALTACSGAPILPDDPFESDGPALTLVPVNHTDRDTIDLSLDKYWTGGVFPHSGGGAAACCYPGLKDWSQPVTVRWTWGAESAKDGKPAKPPEKHAVVVHFPTGGPKNGKQERATNQDDRYLCVILRDLNTAELAFSPSARGCATK